jgi:hypothetical protein
MKDGSAIERLSENRIALIARVARIRGARDEDYRDRPERAVDFEDRKWPGALSEPHIRGYERRTVRQGHRNGLVLRLREGEGGRPSRTQQHFQLQHHERLVLDDQDMTHGGWLLIYVKRVVHEIGREKIPLFFVEVNGVSEVHHSCA